MKSLRHAPALIFDLDGVLWDSNRIHQRAFQAVLAPLGVTVPPYEMIAGMRTDEAMERILRQAGVPCGADEVHRLTSLKRDQARDLLQREPPLKPRCQEVLTHLAGRHKLALVSSASRGSVDVFLQASQTRPLFRVVLSGDEVTAAKPSPDIYLAALECLGVVANEAYVVEDSESGITAARAAGIAVLVFRTPGGPRPFGPLIAGGIDSLDELLAL